MGNPFMLSGLRSRFWEQGGKFCCQLDVPLRVGGSISLLAVIDGRKVLEAMRRQGLTVQKRAGKNVCLLAGVVIAEAADSEMGSFFGSIGKAFKKVAKSSVLKKALNLGKALVKSPLVRLVAPQAAMAIEAAEGAAKLISAAKGKDKNKASKAKLAIVAAQGQAAKEKQAGKPLPAPRSVRQASPRAQNTYRYLVQVAHAA
jgi:hypothetical protein